MKDQGSLLRMIAKETNSLKGDLANARTYADRLSAENACLTSELTHADEGRDDSDEGRGESEGGCFEV